MLLTPPLDNATNMVYHKMVQTNATKLWHYFETGLSMSPIEVGSYLSWLELGYVTLGTGVRIPDTAITFSDAAIHFPAVYNL